MEDEKNLKKKKKEENCKINWMKNCRWEKERAQNWYNEGLRIKLKSIVKIKEVKPSIK